jgi:hypothetical protein
MPVESTKFSNRCSASAWRAPSAPPSRSSRSIARRVDDGRCGPRSRPDARDRCLRGPGGHGNADRRTHRVPRSPRRLAPRLRSACSWGRRVHGRHRSRLSVADARCGCHRDREIVANAAGHAGSNNLNLFGGARRSTTAVTGPASCMPARFISAFNDIGFGRRYRAASAMMSVSVASTSFATAWRPGVP